MTAPDCPGDRDQQQATEGWRAGSAEERGEGICRTCLAPIWNEGGTVRRRKRAEGWSDRIERGGDSLVCFKAVGYRHVPLTGREAAIYDHARREGEAAARADGDRLRERIDGDQLRDALRTHHPIMRSETGPFSGCRCGQVRLGQNVIAHVVERLRAALDAE